MTSSDAHVQPWSITKAEWDGFNRHHGWRRWVLWAGFGLQVLLAIGIAFGLPSQIRALGVGPAGPLMQHGFTVLGSLMLAFAIGQLLFIRSSRRKFERIRPLVWESQGCVCPWCRVRVDETPCPGHGFTRANQPVLLSYWESLPNLARADTLRAVQALDAVARRRPAAWRVAAPVRRMAYASWTAASDPDATPLQRLRASLPWTGVKLLIGACALLLAFKLLPRHFVASFLSGCWPVLIAGPLVVLIGPMWRVGRLRCTACGQPCATAQPTLCPECGADLTQPGAIARHEKAPRRRLALLVIPLLLLGVMPVFQDSIVGVLPKPLRHAIWTNLKPPLRYWQGLNPATMTQAEIDEASQVLIACAAPDGARPLLDFAFLDALQKAGKLTPATLESAARTVVQARLEVAQADGRVTATVSPAFGEQILPSRMTPRLVFCGISIDEGPSTPPADWSLFHDDIDEFWRANGQLPALPEEKLLFRADLGDLPAGTHRVRARCLIVLHEWRWVRYEPQFDGRGELIVPAGAPAYELLLEAEMTFPGEIKVTVLRETRAEAIAR